MTAELTAEEIVTNLLSSHQILKRSKDLKISSPLDLGAYLSNLPEEENGETNNECTTPSSSYLLKEVNKNSKYTFIKEGRWHF